MNSTPFVGGADTLQLIGTDNAKRATSQAIIRQLSNSETFQAMLDQARRGDVASGLQVKTTKDCAITLTPDQIERLSAAADIAEAYGAGRAIFLIDGQALRMDVGTRTVLGPVDVSKTGVLNEADAILTVAASNQPAQTAIAKPGSPVGMNASLLRVLSQRA